jgi:hypothetical protein
LFGAQAKSSTKALVERASRLGVLHKLEAGGTTAQ